MELIWCTFQAQGIEQSSFDRTVPDAKCLELAKDIGPLLGAH